MGFTSTDGATRADIIADRVKTWTQGSFTDRCVTHAVRGNHLWQVRERTSTDGTPAERWIMLSLMAADPGYGWGSKDIGESMGPVELGCPVSYLDMVPDPGGYATAWRRKVRAEAARKGQKLCVGQTVKLLDGCTPSEVTITSLSPLTGVCDGMRYRIPRRHLAAPEGIR